MARVFFIDFMVKVQKHTGKFNDRGKKIEIVFSFLKPCRWPSKCTREVGEPKKYNICNYKSTF